MLGIRQGLLQPRHAYTGSEPAFAAVRHYFPGEEFQQGGLASAVATQQAQLVAAPNDQFNLVEQNLGAVLEIDLVEFEQWHI